MKATASSGIGTSPIYHALRSGVGGQVDSKSNDNNVTMAAGSPVRSPTNESAPNRSAFSKISTHGVAVPMAKAIDSIAPQQGTEVFAVHVLHGNVVQPIHLADVVDPAHVGMRHLARDAHLVVEARQHAFVAGRGFRQELQPHRLPQRQVRGRPASGWRSCAW